MKCIGIITSTAYAFPPALVTLKVHCLAASVALFSNIAATRFPKSGMFDVHLRRDLLPGGLLPGLSSSLIFRPIRATIPPESGSITTTTILQRALRLRFLIFARTGNSFNARR